MKATVKRARAITAPPRPAPAEDPAVERALWRVRLRVQRRLRWLHVARTAGAATPGGLAVAPDRVDLALTGRDDPAAEAAWLAADQGDGALSCEIDALEQLIASDRTSRLARLCSVFGLDARETDALHGTFALALDPLLDGALAALTGRAEAAFPESLLGRLFGRGRRGAPHADGALRAWELVRRHEGAAGATLEIDPLVFAWLLGRDELDATLAGCARRLSVYEPLPSWPLAETVALLRAALDRDPTSRLRVQVLGVPGSGRRTFAASVAAQLGFGALAIDADDVDPGDWPRAFRRAQRQAFLSGLTLVWAGEQARRRWPSAPDMFAVQLAVAEPGAELVPHPRLVDHHVELPVPPWQERRALWRRYVPEAAEWPEAGLDALARTHRVGPGDIASAARHFPADAREAGRVVRRGARHRLGDLAQLLETTFEWDDLVVGDELRRVLEDIVYEASNRALLWDRPEARRLFPQGRGLPVLFSGPPGTGKTMAAQVIAQRLGLDLFRIDLSTVVSKYVGETSQNLQRVLTRASRTDAVLFFDECDALFSRRTEVRDAHDRFANTDTGHLLQAIESYQGIAVLASNRKGNIDPAFMRRLRYSLEFPKPSAAHRTILWQRLVSELAGADRGAALDASLRVLAEAIEATGAQIKSIVLGALFAAGRENLPLGVPHLLRALDRELAKEGRVVSDRERQRLLLQVR